MIPAHVEAVKNLKSVVVNKFMIGEIQKLEQENISPQGEQILFQKRMDDLEANKLINERIDVDSLAKKMETGVFENEARIDIIQAFARLVLELREKIGQYETILVDDASGRVPGIFLGEVAKLSRAKKGLRTPDTFFIAAGKHRMYSKTLAIKDFLEGKKTKLGNTLLVTEFIQTGNSINEIVKILEDINVDFTVAALSAPARPDDSGNMQRAKRHYEGKEGLRKRLVYGGIEGGGMLFYKNYISGVEKHQNNDPHASAREMSDEGRHEVVAIRKDMRMLANEMMVLLDK